LGVEVQHILHPCDVGAVWTCFDLGPWIAPGLKLRSVEQETTDEAI
jgi:hypothetical protein